MTQISASVHTTFDQHQSAADDLEPGQSAPADVAARGAHRSYFEPSRSWQHLTKAARFFYNLYKLSPCRRVFSGVPLNFALPLEKGVRCRKTLCSRKPTLAGGSCGKRSVADSGPKSIHGSARCLPRKSLADSSIAKPDEDPAGLSIAKGNRRCSARRVVPSWGWSGIPWCSKEYRLVRAG